MSSQKTNSLKPSEDGWEPELKFWDECYETGKTGWDRGAVHPALLQWLHQQHLKPCRIAVPGCGNGHEVVELVRRGFDVTSIDFASEPLRRLQASLDADASKCQIVQSDLFQYKWGSQFEAVYEQTCLCAIAPSKRIEYERLLASCIESGGGLFVLFAQTGNDSGRPPFHCEMVEMRKLFSSDRWEWQIDSPSRRLDGNLQQFQHPSGKLYEYAVRLKRKT